MLSFQSSGVPWFKIVLQKGLVQAAANYFDGVRTIAISDTSKLALLSADKSYNDRYTSAMWNQHPDVIQSYMACLDAIPGSEKEKIRLLEARSKDGTLGMLESLRQGNMDAARAYVDGIERMQLSNSTKLTLLDTVRKAMRETAATVTANAEITGKLDAVIATLRAA